MKKLVMLTVASSLLLLFLTLNVNGARACGRFSCTDPQVCINSELLTVAPSAGAFVTVTAPADAVVDFNVADCGGTEAPLPLTQFFTGGSHKIVVNALTDPGAAVTADYGGGTQTGSMPNGKVKFQFDLP